MSIRARSLLLNIRRNTDGLHRYTDGLIEPISITPAESHLHHPHFLLLFTPTKM